MTSAIADPTTTLVTLTVTEKGYGLDPASGGLDSNNPDIRHDLANPASPRSALRSQLASSPSHTAVSVISGTERSFAMWCSRQRRSSATQERRAE